MKRQLVAAVVGAVFTFSAGAALAAHHAPTPKSAVKRQHERHRQIERRIDRQEAQVKRGVRGGRLLRREASFLKGNLRGIKRSYRRANRDRYIDRTEWRRINFLLTRNSRIIYALEDSPSVRYYRVR